MYNCLTAELWKAIHNRLFFYSLAIGIGLALADVIQNAEAVQRMTEILIELDQDGIPVAMDHEGFSLFIRWISVNGYTYGNQVFYLIWPILVAIPYGWSYFEDRKEGVYNHLVCQSGRKNYFISKYIATYISGGLAIMLPVLLNLLMNALICPYCVPSVSSSINSIFNGWFLAEIYYTNPWLFALIWCGIDFLFGGATACLCLLVNVRKRNRLSIILFPFVVYFVIEVISSVVSGFAEINIETSPLQLARAATSSPNPGYMLFSLIGLLSLGSFLIGSYQVNKHEMV